MAGTVCIIKCSCVHWLPIQKRIMFKLQLIVTYKELNGQAPSYISELLTNYKPSRNLRSRTKNLLTVPRSNTKTYGDRSFQVAAAKLFNELPTDLKSTDSTNSFKAKLKTYLFNIHIFSIPCLFLYFFNIFLTNCNMKTF